MQTLALFFYALYQTCIRIWAGLSVICIHVMHIPAHIVDAPCWQTKHGSTIENHGGIHEQCSSPQLSKGNYEEKMFWRKDWVQNGATFYTQHTADLLKAQPDRNSKQRRSRSPCKTSTEWRHLEDALLIINPNIMDAPKNVVNGIRSSFKT